MSIRSMLVHVDAMKSSVKRIQIARELAEQFGAKLTALYAATPLVFTSPAFYTGEVAAMLEELDDERLAEAKASFGEACGLEGCKVSWAEMKGVSALQCVVEQSRFADLVVLGQRDARDDLSATLPGDFVESVVLQGGRPVLVLPYAGQAASRMDRIIVAWNGSCESARALTAAIPFLRRAASVRVLGWTGMEAVAEGQPLDLEAYLAAHGVKASISISDEPHVDAGNALLNAAADDSADMIVMGCYGHSRAREWVLGGATRAILQSMTVPVLMAH